MSNLRQVGLGILAALVSVAILFGSLSLALMENAPRASLSSFMTWTPLPTVPTPLVPTGVSSPSPTPTATPTATATPSSSITASPTGSIAATATATPTASPAASSTPTPCHHPSGWSLITVHSGDTLESLAAAYNITPTALARANCLPSSDLSQVSKLYVPNIAPTQTTWSCGQPYGWVNYTVQAGDTLFHLSQLLGVTVQQLMVANCLPNDQIQVGQHLYVPHYLPTSTNVPTTKPGKTPKPPTSTPRPPTPTSPVSPTNTSVPPTNTTVPPSDTPVPPTHTPVPPSDTPVPPTHTPVPPSDTPVPPTRTPVPPSDTPVPPTHTPVPPPDTPVPTTLLYLRSSLPSCRMGWFACVITPGFETRINV